MEVLERVPALPAVSEKTVLATTGTVFVFSGRDAFSERKTTYGGFRRTLPTRSGRIFVILLLIEL
jgi:hypothetical protein